MKKLFEEIEKILFLILFFKEDGFAFRYPMNVFFSEKVSEKNVMNKWNLYNEKEWFLQLYIHSIYCDTRCNYCDCEALLRVNETDTKIYRDYMLQELEKYSTVIKKPLDSIYFGWGTFNLASDEEIREMSTKILENFSLSEGYSWQVEIHPFYLTSNTLHILKDFGVTDIMFGVQTTSEKVNRYNNRKFSKTKLDMAINQAIECGFKKISFDLMYNLPSMTLDDLINDLEYIYAAWQKIKNHGLDVNLEINRWDISIKTGFANIFLGKYWKDKFLDLCKYYISTSKKAVKIVDTYIDGKFLWLFDTHRREIEERKTNNTAIVWIGLSATSYIPWVIAYEDVSYGSWKQNKKILNGYSLSEIDNYLSFMSDNLRRWIPFNIFAFTQENSAKFNTFTQYYDSLFVRENDNIRMNISTDLENDILNLYLIDDAIFQKRKIYLLKRWTDLWFTMDELELYSKLFLDYYYKRNRLYG